MLEAEEAEADAGGEARRPSVTSDVSDMRENSVDARCIINCTDGEFEEARACEVSLRLQVTTCPFLFFNMHWCMY